VPERLLFLENNPFTREALNDALLFKVIEEPCHCNSGRPNDFSKFLDELSADRSVVLAQLADQTFSRANSTIEAAKRQSNDNEEFLKTRDIAEYAESGLH
jgi:hypothetical protein